MTVQNIKVSPADIKSQAEAELAEDRAKDMTVKIKTQLKLIQKAKDVLRNAEKELEVMMEEMAE